MTVKVIRKKERLNTQWTELEVYMDGEKKTSIFGSGSSEIGLEDETAELKVKHIMSRGAARQVKRGDIVEVSNAPLAKYLLYAMPVILLLMFASSYFDLFNFWVAAVVAAVFIIAAGSIKPLQIEVVSSSHESGN